jgi:hypothetical protein
LGDGKLKDGKEPCLIPFLDLYKLLDGLDGAWERSLFIQFLYLGGFLDLGNLKWKFGERPLIKGFTMKWWTDLLGMTLD